MSSSCSQGPLQSTKKEFAMLHAAYFRAQAELCFGIARSLSDPVAAKKTLTLANDYVRRAEEVDEVEEMEKSCKSKPPNEKSQPTAQRKGGGMSASSYFERVYGPEMLTIMVDAFDHAH